MISIVNLLWLFVVFAVIVIITYVSFFKSQEARSQLEQTVLALAAAVEAKDIYTLDHSRQVAEIAAKIAKKMGHSQREVQQIHFAGLLHDIGKIGTPDYILQKTDRLSKTEFAEVQRHTEIGYDILKAAGENLAAIANLVRHHHERWDGQGYPDGLKGEEIPLGAAILAVADAYDAMISNRPYRQALLEPHVLEELKKGAGYHFHPGVVKVFLDNYREIMAESIEGEPVLLPAAGGETLSFYQKVIKKQHTDGSLRSLRPFDYLARYKSILESTSSVILVLSQDLQILEWNHNAEDYYDYSVEELKQLNFRKFLPPGAFILLDKQLERAKETGIVALETELQIKEGAVFPVELRMSVFTQAGEKYWLTIIRDISERKNWEQQVRQQEHKYRTIFEGVTDPLVIYDMELNILEVNQAAGEQFGYTREELLQMKLTNLSTRDGALKIAQLNLLVEQGKLLYESEYRSKAGVIVPVEINATIINVDGRPVVLAVVRDLSSRQQNLDLAGKMLDAIPHSAYLVTGDRVVVAANKTARQVGVLPGGKCYHTIFGRKNVCPHCAAEKALQLSQAHSGVVEVLGKKHLAYWVPIDDRLYLHYFQEILPSRGMGDEQ